MPINETVKILLNGIKRKSEFVFRVPKGSKFDNIKWCFRKAVELDMLDDFSFHYLRHTTTTRIALYRAVTNLDTNSDFSNELLTKQKRQAQDLP